MFISNYTEAWVGAGFKKFEVSSSVCAEAMALHESLTGFKNSMAKPVVEGDVESSLNWKRGKNKAFHQLILMQF